MSLTWDDCEDVPVARLALRLQRELDVPAHLDPERLSDAFRAEFDLRPPVTLADTMRVLEELKIQVNPPIPTQLLPPTQNGFNQGDPRTGQWMIVINPKRSAARKVQTGFHELYEVLRPYFQIDAGKFPEGWNPAHYCPERYARWFAAAVTLPRDYVLRFVELHGHDPEMLRSESHTSRNMTARRLRELVPDVPLVLVECALPNYLFQQPIPAFRCIESVRSSEFSVRLDSSSGRKYHIPRKREVWTAGALVQQVAETRRLVFVERVTGSDLFHGRDMCALGVPLYRKTRLVSVAIYATPTSCRYVWNGVIERMEPILVDEMFGLTGAAQKRAPRRRKPGAPETGVKPLPVTLNGEPVPAKRFKNPHAPKPEPVPEGQLSFAQDTAIPTMVEEGQLKWGMDEVGVGEELYVP